MASEAENELVPLRREFDQIWHGYDRNQVHQYLEHVESQIRQLITDRNAAHEQSETLARELEDARSELTKLRTRVDELKRPPQNMDDLDERMQRTIRQANEEAEEITSRAQVAAEEHWERTVAESKNLRERYSKLLGDLDSAAEALQEEHENALAATRAEVAELTDNAARRRQQLDNEAERRRRAVEEEFDQTMAAERQKLEKYLHDQHTAAKNHAERRIAEANAEAKRLVDEADTEAQHRVQKAKEEAERVTTEASEKCHRLARIHEQARERLTNAEHVLQSGAEHLVPADNEESTLDPRDASAPDDSAEHGPSTDSGPAEVRDTEYLEPTGTENS